MKSKGIWVVLSVLVVLGLILASCAKAPAPTAPTTPTASTTPTAPAAPQVIKWQGQFLSPSPPPLARYPWPPGPNGGNIEGAFLEWIEKASGGRLVINMAPAGSIVPEQEMLTAVENRTLDMGGNYGAYFAGIMPEANIEAGLPFAWDEPGMVMDYLYQMGGKEILDEAYAEHNIWPIITSMGCLQGIGGVGMVTGPEWFKGKKVRAAGIWQKWVGKMGGNAVIIPYPEMYMAIKLGTIAGYLASATALESVKLKEVLDSYVIYPNGQCYGISLQFNRDSLNALPEDIREMIMRDGWAIQENLMVTRNWPEDRRRPFRAEADGYIKVIRWSEEDAAYGRQLGYELWDDVAKLSPRTAKMVELLKVQARDWGRMK